MRQLQEEVVGPTKQDFKDMRWNSTATLHRMMVG